MLSRLKFPLLLSSALLALGTAAAPAQQAVYLDTKLTPAARAHDLVGQRRLDPGHLGEDDLAFALGWG